MKAKILFDQENGKYVAKCDGVMASATTKEEALAELRGRIIMDIQIKQRFLFSGEPFEVEEVDEYNKLIFSV